MNAELLNKLKHLANIAAHLPSDVTLEDEDAAMKALHGELAADTVLQMIALAESALLAAAPAPIQQGQLVEVGQMIELDDYGDPRFHTIMCDWDNEARAKLTAGTKIYAVSAGSQVQAAGDARKRVARAIWNLRREDEDRCDMELEDMGDQHSVWAEADAAIAAMREQP